MVSKHGNESMETWERKHDNMGMKLHRNESMKTGMKARQHGNEIMKKTWE